MVKTEDVAAMAAIWEHGQLPDRGVVFGTLWDCRNSERARATDAMIELIPADSAAETLYNLSRGLEATTVTGAFQISNVQPGIATVRAHHAGRIVASADVPVRSGALTWVFFFPTSS
jgi:hypothetical protein